MDLALNNLQRLICHKTKPNQKTSLDHPNYSIPDVGLNTEKSPGDLRRLAVTQTAVKGHQLTL